jgi:hypothetical protein
LGRRGIGERNRASEFGDVMDFDGAAKALKRRNAWNICTIVSVIMITAMIGLAEEREKKGNA